MRALVEKKLLSIVGESVWAVGRAASMLWIQIGKRHTMAAWGGGTKEVGTFALHIDCPWTWRQGNVVIANQDSDLNTLTTRLMTPLVCQSTAATDNGSFEIRFSDHSVLIVTVEAGSEGNEPEENWRLFSPGTDSPHFVVGSNGIRE